MTKATENKIIDKAEEELSNHNFLLNEYYTTLATIKEIKKNGRTKTFNTNVANLYKKYGFNVFIDEFNVNYIIQEA